MKMQILWQCGPHENLPPTLRSLGAEKLCDPQEWKNVEAASVPQRERGSSPNADPTTLVVTQAAEVRTAAQQGYRSFYIPGEHCRQGDLLDACAAKGHTVWLERGSFLAPSDVKHALIRLRDAQRLIVVDAGTQNGYSDRILDPRALRLYQSWGCEFALSDFDLSFGSGENSDGYRPHWVTSPELRDTFLREAMAWGAHFVCKWPSAAEATLKDTTLKMLIELLRGELK